MAHINRDDIEDRIRQGKISKAELAEKLEPGKRQLFMDVCGMMETVFTKRCGACDACLPGGCSMEEGEACLEACLNEGSNYYRVIYAVWDELAD